MKHARTLVVAAAAVVVLLAVTLGFRLLHGREVAQPKAKALTPLPRWTETAPAARVPEPRPATELKVPCWACGNESDGWPIAFRTDLDLLAPLGDGPANAALWLKDFERARGSRFAEAEAAQKRRVDGPKEVGKVLPPDDPLLAEAAPWADQATMRFYPDVFPLNGHATPIPNLLFPLTLAKSWVARALAAPDAPGALDDCRRAVRLGRLLRQDDVTVIQDLVGLACIRVGAHGLYELATRRGDAPLALASAIVLGEHGPQRLRTQQAISRTTLLGEEGARMSEKRVADIAGIARSAPDRRFRLEAILQLAVARSEGSRGVRRVAEEELGKLAATEDPIVAATVAWARTATFTKDVLAELGVTP